MTTLKDALDRIEADLADLKRQYDLFFQGARRTEPHEERRILEWMVRRLGQRKITNTSDQFRFSSLQSRFFSYANLWTRMVRDLEEGRLVRDTRGELVRTKGLRGEPVPSDHLDQVLDQLRSARQECGIPTEEKDLDSLREVLRSRAAEMAERSGGRRVEFRVTIEGGKPKVKAALR
ncbi:MAG TPA: MXAN_5187 C-terminal domain-containing protein [Candidatus Deferrimicrobiaceae bacterium]|nr:MXAN_5187 C-terminal domain-containing protein [Candidatus Deferrimicrobiaceae bacterium]